VTYEVEVPPLPGTGSTHLFIPLAQSDGHQTVDYRIDSPVQGRERTETKYGNRFWVARLEGPREAPTVVRVTYQVERRVVHGTSGTAVPLAPKERSLFLGPNKRVPVDDPLVRDIVASLRPKGEGDRAKAQAIFDYVLENMEYKKVGDGWGHGDTHWACSQQYGNCTDFHALLTSLARAMGIPARFEIGIPVPRDGDAGTVSGYHCWLSLYIDGGWFPVDASEAWKHPLQRAQFFGAQPADRLGLTVGRDLSLGPEHVGPALNYFVYPHVERRGEAIGDVKTTFSYRATPE